MPVTYRDLPEVLVLLGTEVGELTAFFAMCLPFTLPRVSEIAATDVPPSAMKTAIVAITLA